MKIEIITRLDLEELKAEILNEVKNMFNNGQSEYLSSRELCDYFKISATKLYELRITGKIPFKKIGGAYRYNKNEIVKHFTK